jgi:hypothetical protein
MTGGSEQSAGNLTDPADTGRSLYRARRY